MTRVAIGLGSNVGDRREHLESAVVEMASCGEVTAVSSLYETAPIGLVEQPAFLNAVALLAVEREPRDVLTTLQGIETARGRTRGRRWGPRTIDLDILLFGDRFVAEPGLTIPHPRMTERRFVLQPLLEVWPDAELPEGTPLVRFLPSVADQDVRVVAADWVALSR